MASNPFINLNKPTLKFHRFYPIIVGLALLLTCLGMGGQVYLKQETLARGYAPVSTKLDSYQGVEVYSNGPFYQMVYGFNFSNDGYCYGFKWQCVEYIRRFYYNHFNHVIPKGFKHAKYYYDPSLAQGELNTDLNLRQFLNGGHEKPQVNDILVFTSSQYGHVAIVTEVNSSSIEIIQQNRSIPRQTLKLEQHNHHYVVGEKVKPVAWLRLP